MNEQVKRGAAWMDERYPGWENRINLNVFNLNTLSCVICQGAGPGMYSKHFCEAGSQEDGCRWANDHAFYDDAKNHDDWVNLIQARRGAKLLEQVPELEHA